MYGYIQAILTVIASFISCRSLPSGPALKLPPLREDPCSAQGSRPSSQSIEINPNYVHKQETDSESSTESVSEGEPYSVRLQPTPSSQLLVKRRRRRRKSSMVCDGGSQVENSESDIAEVSSMDSPRQSVETGLNSHKRRPRASVSLVKSLSLVGGEGRSEGKDLASVDRVNKVSEQRRHVSTLFSPNSPLLNENLKVCLHSECSLYLLMVVIRSAMFVHSFIHVLCTVLLLCLKYSWLVQCSCLCINMSGLLCLSM